MVPAVDQLFKKSHDDGWTEELAPIGGAQPRHEERNSYQCSNVSRDVEKKGLKVLFLFLFLFFSDGRY